MELMKHTSKRISIQRCFAAVQLECFCTRASNGRPYRYIDEDFEVCERCSISPQRIIGSFLCNRSKPEWESVLNKLEKTPNVKIHNVSRLSYDRLEDEEKDIFLDIACFFKLQGMDRVMKMLYSCGFSADIGISALIDKFFISVSRDKISIHDLLQEMAREIVRQESLEEPGKRSRLFRHEDFYHVVTKNYRLMF